MRPDQDLLLKAANLARANPQVWSEFVGAFKAYTDERRDQVVSAPLDKLPVAQGQAQALRDALKLLEGCNKRAEEIAAMRARQEGRKNVSWNSLDR